MREDEGRQVESVTFGWMTKERAIEYLTYMLSSDFIDEIDTQAINKWEESEEHCRCRYCA